MLGTPSREDILGMNPNYNEFRFPQIKSHPWSKVFHAKVDADAIDLVSCFLKYAPTQRVSGLEALGHPFFSEILQPDCTLPNGMYSSSIHFPYQRDCYTNLEYWSRAEAAELSARISCGMVAACCALLVG